VVVAGVPERTWRRRYRGRRPVPIPGPMRGGRRFSDGTLPPREVAEAATPETPSPPAVPAGAEEKSVPAAPEAWELDAFVGYGQLGYPALDMANGDWSNGGPGFAVTVAYRGRHFTHPFLDLSYVPIISSGRYVNVYVPGTPVATTFASNSAYALGFVLGPGWDIDWFRIRGGLGLFGYNVRTTVSGVTNKVSLAGLGFLVTASALVWRPEPFALGVEGRMVALEMPTGGIYQFMREVGFTARWDFVHHP
jgi:hypothetical protein